jgi:hypothetical protein
LVTNGKNYLLKPILVQALRQGFGRRKLRELNFTVEDDRNVEKAATSDERADWDFTAGCLSIKPTPSQAKQRWGTLQARERVKKRLKCGEVA